MESTISVTGTTVVDFRDVTIDLKEINTFIETAAIEVCFVFGVLQNDADGLPNTDNKVSNNKRIHHEFQGPQGMLTVEVNTGFTTSASTAAYHYFSGAVSAQDFKTIDEVFTEQVVAVVGQERKYSIKIQLFPGGFIFAQIAYIMQLLSSMFCCLQCRH